MVPNVQTDREKIAAAIEEIVDDLVRIEAIRDHIKAVKEMLKEEYGLPPKEAGKLARIRYKQNLTEVISEAEELEASYELLFPSN